MDQARIINNFVHLWTNYEKKELAKSLNPHYWHKETKSWQYPLWMLPDLIRSFPEIGHSQEIRDALTALKSDKSKEFDPESAPAYLYNHQKKAFGLARGKPYALFMDTGTGKTPAVIELIRDDLKDDPGRKYLVVAPLSILSAAWGEDLMRFAPDLKYSIVSGDKKTRAIKRTEEKTIYITNFESYRVDHEEWKAMPFRGIVVDECFVGSTMVDTPRGKKRIDKIKKGDKVLNCSGIDIVKSVAKRTRNDSLILTTIEDRCIISSRHHPFFTSRGWVYACSLMEGDHVIETESSAELLSLREATDPATNQEFSAQREERTLFLRKILLREMADEPARNKGKSVHAGNIQKNIGKSKAVYAVGSAGCPVKDRKGEGVEAYEKQGNKKKSVSGATSYGTSTSSARRQGPVYPTGARKTDECDDKMLSGKEICNGTMRFSRKKESRVSNELHAGRVLPRIEAGSGSGRLFAHVRESQGARFEKKVKTKFLRVDRVEVLEPRDKRLNRYRDSKGRVVLYDLEMKTHPSFSVNGFLVHNSSKMKDPTSQITKKLLEHSRQVALRWIMSGTPAPNSPLEYWAQITFIEPSLLGKSFYGFRNHFAHQVGYGGYTWIVDGEKLLKLQKIISQVSFSVSKDDCLDLPERIHSKRDVLLTEVQKKFYQEMKRTLTLEISEGMITAANAAVKCSKLRQISSGFIYDEDGEVTHRMEHRKINVLEEILDEIPATEPVIIWYNFNAEKEEILSCLTERKESVEIYGAENREAVDRFREGKTRIIIANPASLGHGITLTNCCYAIYYSLSYSLEQFHQSRDRIYRIGQTRKCQYFYIVAPGTIEVDILRALQKKQTIAEAVLGALK